jgi:hypothetical protein
MEIKSYIITFKHLQIVKNTMILDNITMFEIVALINVL